MAILLFAPSIMMAIITPFIEKETNVLFIITFILSILLVVYVSYAVFELLLERFRRRIVPYFNLLTLISYPFMFMFYILHGVCNPHAQQDNREERENREEPHDSRESLSVGEFDNIPSALLSEYLQFLQCIGAPYLTLFTQGGSTTTLIPSTERKKEAYRGCGK